MVKRAIPVDLRNPGQVFACLGFLEAAAALLDMEPIGGGPIRGGFDWSDPDNPVFMLTTQGSSDPFRIVLEYLKGSVPVCWAHARYVEEPLGQGNAEGDLSDDRRIDPHDSRSPTVFPSARADRSSLPICFGLPPSDPGTQVYRLYPFVELGHWADGSDRNAFKLYGGNRSARNIARALLGVPDKPETGARASHSKGIGQLLSEVGSDLIARPFDILTPMDSSFNFDPRGAWTAVRAGRSSTNQNQRIASSPVVEFLAAWGLEHARPDEFEPGKVRYAVWGVPLRPMLARAALCGSLPMLPQQTFVFRLETSGDEKLVTFAEPEPSE